MNWHIGSSGLFFLSILTLVNLMSQDANASSDYPEELFDECVNVAGKSFCDFLFKKSAVNPTNSTASMPSNYTESTNSMSGSWNASSPPINSPLNSSYLTYDDNDLGFSIQYPSDWTIGSPDSEFNTVASFSSPQCCAQVDIRIFPKGDYKTIKDYGDTFKESDNDYILLKYYRNSSTTLSGKPAFKAIYLTTYNPTIIEKTYGYKSSTSKAMMVATMVPEKDSIYAIAYFDSPPDFDKFLPVIENITHSFQIYANAPIIQEDNSSSISPD